AADHAAVHRRWQPTLGCRAADRAGPAGRLAGRALPRHPDRARGPADGRPEPAGRDAQGAPAGRLTRRPARPRAGPAAAAGHRAVPVGQTCPLQPRVLLTWRSSCVRMPSGPELLIASLTLSVLELILGFNNVVFISIPTTRLPKNKQQRARI